MLSHNYVYIHMNTYIYIYYVCLWSFFRSFFPPVSNPPSAARLGGSNSTLRWFDGSILTMASRRKEEKSSSGQGGFKAATCGDVKIEMVDLYIWIYDC